MLYEVRSAGVKSSGMLIRQELIGLKATLKGLADGSVYDVDPAIYDSIPPPPDHVSAILTCLTKSESGHIYSCILNLNEYMPSNGAIALIRDLSSNAKEAKLIRDELTVIIVPRVNIDGFDATISGEPWRYNVDPFCSSSCPPYYGRNQGYDINRYHPYLTDYPLDDPNTPLPDDQNPVPESLNVRALYDMAGGADDVAVVFDLHGQGTPLDANRDLVTGSTLWPTATDTADDLGIRDQFDDVVYSDIPRRAVMSVIEALADGSLYETDIARAETLERAPDSASLFWKCVVASPYTLDNYNFCREKYGLSPRDTLPPFPFEPGAPGPGEVLDGEVASQLIYELDTE